jgi:hypothetical protein
LVDSLDTPIVFMVFNRPKPTRVVFKAIAKARPSRLLLVADGARPERPSEANLCRQVREIVQQVDWPCKIDQNFAETNLGCRERVISGLDWAFSLVEEAIILEDDCLPDSSFFPFCEELLARYRDDSRVGMISGDNFVSAHVKDDSSYYFSRMPHIWGWATWRSEWARYDRRLSRWPDIRKSNLLCEIFDDPRVMAHWTNIFDAMHSGTGPNTWDYQWVYTMFVNNALSVTPRANLVENIGFGADATHTTQHERALCLPANSIEFPLRHPPAIVPLRSLDRLDQRISLPPSLPLRALRKIRGLRTRATHA